MNAAFRYDEYNGFTTADDDTVSGVLASLLRNNTFCPNVRKCRKTKKNGKDVLVVSFTDDTWVTVSRSEADKDDDAMAFLYAIAKRLFGKPTTGGYVEGDGFMTKIKNLVASIKTDEDLEKEKENRRLEKEAADKKAHEEAVARHERNPTVSYRLRNLEDKFDRLCDLLEGSKKSGKSVR